VEKPSRPSGFTKSILRVDIDENVPDMMKTALKVRNLLRSIARNIAATG
jgi:hypothetical protein